MKISYGKNYIIFEENKCVLELKEWSAKKLLEFADNITKANIPTLFNAETDCQLFGNLYYNADDRAKIHGSCHDNLSQYRVSYCVNKLFSFENFLVSPLDKQTDKYFLYIYSLHYDELLDAYKNNKQDKGKLYI